MSFFDSVMRDVHAACDDIFAHEARFLPAAGGEHACMAELSQPEPEFAQGDAKVITADWVLRVVKGALPAPRKNDVFELTMPNNGLKRFRVLAAPTTDDDDGLRWTIKVEALS